MTLIHYSREPLREVLSVEQDDNDHFNFKPRGLWVSVLGEDDWRRWVESEEFMLDNYTCATEVVLSSDAKILRISSLEEFDAFQSKYLIVPLGLSYISGTIDWPRLAFEYHGIIIAPYQWARRFDNPIWYYGWDCASGCIWNADAIAMLCPAPEHARVQQKEEETAAPIAPAAHITHE